MANFAEGTGVDFTNATQTMLAGNAAMDNPSERWTTSGVQTANTAMLNMANALNDIAAQNSARSQAYAREQMAFQRESQLLNMRYNTMEAAKTRNWQEYLSNTAHRREVRDLMLAGLNPVLSASGGNGASVGSGATAAMTSAPSGASGQVDTSLNNSIVALLGSMLNSQTELANAALTANNNMAMSQLTNQTNKIINDVTNATNMYMNERTNLTNKEITEMNNLTSKIIATITGEYSLRGSQAIAGATAYGAMMANEASHYNTDQMYKLGMANPTSPFGFLGRVLNGLFGVDYDNLGKNTGYSKEQIRDMVKNSSGKIIDFWSNAK